MHNFMSTVWLIPLVPMLATAWIALGYILKFNRGEEGESQTSRTAMTAASLSLVLILIQDIFALIYGAPGQLRLGTWLSSGDYQVFLSFTLDKYSLVMATLVALISLITTRFSINYLHREAGYQRFFMIMSLFSGAMLLIILAGNAVLAFIGWELAGVSSFLLIGYAYDRPNATANANQAFITNRIGDAGFILAIALSFIWFGGIEWPEILKNNEGLSSLHVGAVAGSFLLAAMAKSALLPFTPWVEKALEGPTPSSAIFYGAVMVHAGIFLIIRLQPLFLQDAALLPLLAIIGLLTALYGFFCGLVQTDVKSALIFSVISQVGLMLLLCGLGQFELAFWYMVLHASWRSYQFLNAPAHMHQMNRPTRPANTLIQRFNWLYTASLQRFWLDHIIRWALIRPTLNLSRDARNFEEHVVTPIVGLPAQASTLTTLDQETAESRVGKGQGLAGGFMQWLASILGWFEEHLVLKGSGQGLMKLIQHLGGYVLKIEAVLSQPRYLLILIVATFVVIL